MRHAPVDRHARGSSFFSVEPASKLVGVVAFVTCVAFLASAPALLAALAFGIALVLLSGVPPGHYLKRYAIALPFIAFPALSALVLFGPERSAVFILRISTCVIVLLVLISTTPFFDIVRSLRRMGLPEAFTVMLTFLYRFLFLFEEELERMLRARRARGFMGGKWLWDRRIMGAIASTAGMVLVRAHRRGVRVYDALVARGYAGEIRTLDRWRLDLGSAAFLSTLSAFGIFLVLFDRGWLLGWH